MATGPFQAYELGLLELAKGTYAFEAQTDYKAALLEAAYTPNLATHSLYSDLTNEWAGGGGYTTGGLALSTHALAITQISGGIKFDCSDITWGASTTIGPVKYCAIYQDAVTKRLLFLCDLDTTPGSVSSTASAFTITINTNGLYQIDANA